MDLYACSMCGHIYDSNKGEPKVFNKLLCNSEDALCDLSTVSTTPYVKGGTDFTALPENWKCPVCGYPKKYYRKITPEPLKSIRTIA
jgi:rubredoxin